MPTRLRSHHEAFDISSIIFRNEYWSDERKELKVVPDEFVAFYDEYLENVVVPILQASPTAKYNPYAFRRKLLEVFSRYRRKFDSDDEDDGDGDGEGETGSGTDVAVNVNVAPQITVNPEIDVDMQAAGEKRSGDDAPGGEPAPKTPRRQDPPVPSSRQSSPRTLQPKASSRSGHGHHGMGSSNGRHAMRSSKRLAAKRSLNGD